MEVTPVNSTGAGLVRIKTCQDPGAPCVAVWVKVPDGIIHLDLAIETGIQDIDLAFVCRPRL